MRVENIDWDRCTYFNADSKTKGGVRWVPLSDRVLEILQRRCADRTQGWVWQSRYKGKHIGAAMVNRQWVRARDKAGLAKDLVLYCARHDFGTSMMDETGNLKLVMELMGHRDVPTAMKYQHPRMDKVRTALNARNASASQQTTAHFAAHQKNDETERPVSA